jgi:hypothetical protein
MAAMNETVVIYSMRATSSSFNITSNILFAFYIGFIYIYHLRSSGYLVQLLRSDFFSSPIKDLSAFPSSGRDLSQVANLTRFGLRSVLERRYAAN